MTFNPKWHDQADDLDLARRRRADVIMSLGLTITVIGLSLLFTEWFDTGLFVAVAGFTLATIGEEMGK